MYYLIPLVILALCWIAPFPIMIILMVVDFLVPDPIPAIDEILLVIMFFGRLKKILFIQKFIEEHKILTVLLLVLLVAGVFMLGSWLFRVLGIV
jgi:hypothetical protein